MFDMVQQSSNQSAGGKQAKGFVAQACETDRVQLNLQTVKPENIKEVALVRILQGLDESNSLRQRSAEKSGHSFSNKVLTGSFEAETVHQRLIPRFNVDQHTQVLVYSADSKFAQGKDAFELDLDICAQVEGLESLVKRESPMMMFEPNK